MDRFRFLTMIAACLLTRPLSAAEPFPGARAFLESHCLECHNADDASGNLDVGGLQFDAENRESFARWVKIHDRVQAGEMPPDDVPRPDARALKSFVNGLATSLTETERGLYARDGRTPRARCIACADGPLSVERGVRATGSG